MRPSYRRIMRMNNAVEKATSNLFWGKKARKKYRGVAGKGGSTLNAVLKDTSGKEE